MNTFETRLADHMHDVAEAETSGLPPTQNLLTRGKQARLRRRAVVTGGVAALVVAAGVVTATVPWSEPSRPPVAEAQSPAVRLAAAVAASDDISYRVKVTWSGSNIEGAFDPASRTGYLNATTQGVDVVYQERLVDGVRFVSSSGSGDVWKRYPDTHDRLAYDKALDGAASASADPESLFDTLVAAGAVIRQTGADFHFEVTVAGVALTGDVTLGADNRIASVTYEQTHRIEKGGQVEVSTASVTVALSDYGTPVRVEQPVNVVVVQK